MRIGKITENALKRSVLKQIKTEYKGIKSAAVGSDCAFSKEEKVYSAVSPSAASISDPGFYTVMKATNSLIAQGITPDHVTLSVMLAPECEEQVLKTIVRDALDAARIQEVTYSGGHTETTTAVNRPVVVASAVGTVTNEQPLFINKPKPGYDLVVTKWIALEGTAMLAREKKENLSVRYPKPFIDEAAQFKKLMSVKAEAAVATRSGALSVHDISNGGIFAALWEMSERAGCGLNVDLKKIPIRQETIEICEFFELNPYLLLSGGALLIAASDGEGLVLELEKAGVPATVIGCLNEGNDKIIQNGEEERYLELPQSDEILRILG